MDCCYDVPLQESLQALLGMDVVREQVSMIVNRKRYHLLVWKLLCLMGCPFGIHVSYVLTIGNEFTLTKW